MVDLLKESAMLVFKENRMEDIHVEKACICPVRRADIRKYRQGRKNFLCRPVSAVQLGNGSSGIAYNFMTSDAWRGLALRDLMLSPDFRIVRGGRSIYPGDNMVYRSLFNAGICAASREYILRRRGRTIREVPMAGKPGGSLAQVGFTLQPWIRYGELRTLGVFDRISAGPYEIASTRKRTRMLKRFNPDLEIKLFDDTIFDGRLLEGYDTVVITGSSITNATLGGILAGGVPADREVIVWGESCSFIPDALFERGVSRIIGFVWKKNLLSHGFGNSHEGLCCYEPVSHLYTCTKGGRLEFVDDDIVRELLERPFEEI